MPRTFFAAFLLIMLTLTSAARAQITNFPWIPGECCGEDGGIFEDFLHEVTSDLRNSGTESSRVRTAIDLAEWMAPLCGYTPSQAQLVANGICSENPHSSAVFRAHASASFQELCPDYYWTPGNDPAYPNLIQLMRVWDPNVLAGYHRLVGPGQRVTVNIAGIVEMDTRVHHFNGFQCYNRYDFDIRGQVEIRVLRNGLAFGNTMYWPDDLSPQIQIPSNEIPGTVFSVIFSLGDSRNAVDPRRDSMVL